jgi:hypothetical protein
MTKPDVEAFLAFVSAAAHAAQFSYEHEGDPVKLKAWLAEVDPDVRIEEYTIHTITNLGATLQKLLEVEYAEQEADDA